MRNEIRSAAYFLADMLRMGHLLSDHQLEIFREALEEVLGKHYEHHWFPETPTKGNGYRCIRINNKMDPLIAQAASVCGVTDSSLLRSIFPNDLTMWVDPKEVSYRIGEHGSICVIYEIKDNPGVPVKNAITSPIKSSPKNHHFYKSQFNHLNQTSSEGSKMVELFEKYVACKESVRGIDQLIIEHCNVGMEQYASFVSS
ncbi:hypothetical protein CHUAL_013752 [Chamberlinius hualienensis]